MLALQTYRRGVLGTVLSILPLLTGTVVRVITEVRVVIIRGCMTLEERQRNAEIYREEETEM